MGLGDWFDPTRTWESASGPAPDPSALSLQIPTLPFGCPLETARALGRPDAFEWRSRREHHCELLYASRGLRLRVNDDKLIEVSDLIGPEACAHAAFAPSAPLAPDGTRLTRDVVRAQIVKSFGEPDPGGSDDECLQIFHGHGVVSDFYLDEQGRLREWSLYPED